MRASASALRPAVRSPSRRGRGRRPGARCPRSGGWCRRTRRPSCGRGPPSPRCARGRDLARQRVAVGSPERREERVGHRERAVRVGRVEQRLRLPRELLVRSASATACPRPSGPRSPSYPRALGARRLGVARAVDHDEASRPRTPPPPRSSGAPSGAVEQRRREPAARLVGARPREARREQRAVDADGRGLRRASSPSARRSFASSRAPKSSPMARRRRMASSTRPALKCACAARSRP